MSHKLGNRYKITMLPKTIDNYVGEADPVRAYDAFINVLNFEKLGLDVDDKKVGNSAYDPIAMLKLLVYGYSYGWRSSRKLERAIHHNLSFIWLVGGLKPDHKTISEFRRKNKKILKKVLKQCVRLCLDLKLIEGNSLFLDGSKIRGNASINKTITKEGLNKKLEKIDERIDEILEECQKVDESEHGSLIKMGKELKENKKLKEKVEKAVKKIEKTGKKKINLTDNDCVNFKGRQGSHAGLNAQTTVDEKHGLIINSDLVTENNDLNQFTDQIKKSNEILGKKCKTACADAGYSNAGNLEETLKEGIEVIVPNQKQAAHNPKETPFGKEKFNYNKEKNCYFCPEGKELKYKGYDKTKKQYSYRITNKSDCINCKHFNKCTSSKNGRTIKRLKSEETKEKLAKFYESDRAQEIYRERKFKVELPFGHIKRNLNGGTFLLRGIEGANAEMAINCSCFNIVRMINLLGGVRLFIEKMKSIMKKN